MGIIFYFSSLPIIKAHRLNIVDFLIKKSAHLAEYFILFLLLFRAYTYSISKSFLTSLAYAFTDEIHQLYTPGRGGSLRDVAIDTLGMVIAYLIIKRRYGQTTHH
ncbi:VanZ family protein [Candidatus Collierbacteria bacterium]|nr:VanZ family protein [Candidatus Collierbacteria bacterium]